MNSRCFVSCIILRSALAAAVLALPAPAGLAATIQVLRSFTGSATDGFTPYGGLVDGRDGYYYGTSQGGGPGNLGTVFRITPAGALTILKFLDGSTGYSPTHALYLHTDGNLYGSGRLGGTGSHGTAFRVTPAGDVTHVASHSFQEGSDASELVAGPDGLLYGVCRLNGANNQGTLFRVNIAAGTITTLASFSGVNGWGPYSGLTLGLDNKLYGNTPLGYPPGSTVSGAGNIFRYTVGGALENVVTFPINRSLGSNLSAPLTRWTDGTFYGSTAGLGSGGPTDNGTIFKVTTAGVITTLVTFNGANGRAGTSKLLIGRGGNFFGTTPAGGTANKGTVFQMTPQGALTTLASFNGANGTQPAGPMVEGADGNLYGTTYRGGGTADGGTVFRVIFGPQIVTQQATAITPTSASLSAEINSFGESATFFFEYGTTTALGSATASASAGATTTLTPVQAPLSGLESNRTYYFRAVGTSASGTRRGEILSFTTPPPPPTVTTQAATNIRAGSATLNGSVTPNGAQTTAHFEYSTDPTFGTGVMSTPNADAGSGETAAPVSAAITGLAPGTIFHARVIAGNSSGASVAESVTFTTNTPPSGGALLLTPGTVVSPAVAMTAEAAGWADLNTPLTYQFLLDGIALGPPGATATINFTAPAVLGDHVATVRVFDALGDFAETSHAFLVDNPPVARTATLGAVSGSTPRIAVAKLLSYASDSDGDAIEIIAVNPTSAQGGAVALSDGIISYTPPVGYSGQDSFSYTLRDARGGTATGTVNVTVTAAPSLNFISITPTDTGWLLRFAGVPGAPYVIQFRDTMTDPWHVLDPPGSIQAGPNGIFEFEDNPNPKPASRFYRAAAP